MGLIRYYDRNIKYIQVRLEKYMWWEPNKCWIYNNQQTSHEQ
jgi:hypothetical protein